MAIAMHIHSHILSIKGLKPLRQGLKRNCVQSTWIQSNHIQWYKVSATYNWLHSIIMYVYAYFDAVAMYIVLKIIAYNTAAIFDFLP